MIYLFVSKGEREILFGIGRDICIRKKEGRVLFIEVILFQSFRGCVNILRICLINLEYIFNLYEGVIKK